MSGYHVGGHSHYMLFGLLAAGLVALLAWLSPAEGAGRGADRGATQGTLSRILL